MSIKVYTDINKLNSKSWDLNNENTYFLNYKFKLFISDVNSLIPKFNKVSFFFTKSTFVLMGLIGE